MIEIAAFYELLNKSNYVLVCDCMKMWVEILGRDGREN